MPTDNEVEISWTALMRFGVCWRIGSVDFYHDTGVAYGVGV